MKLRRLFERNNIWFTAWSLIPLALVVNALVGYDYESSLRWQERAEVASAVGDWPEAARFFEAAAGAAPNSPMPAYNASVAHRQLKDLEGAKHWLQMALIADPHFEPALEAQAALEKIMRKRRRKQEGRSR